MFISKILLLFFIQQTIAIEYGDDVQLDLRYGAVCSVNGLGVDLFKQIALNVSTNFAFSPYIIGNQLALLYIATINETEQEFIKILHLTTDDNTKTEYGYMKLTESLINKSKVSQLVPANIYWYNADPDELLRTDALAYFYTPGVQNSMMHEFKQTIDEWVSVHTNNEITNITENVTIPDDLEGLYLFSTLNFYNLWTVPFNELDKKLPFHTMNRKVQHTKMMSTVLRIGVKEEDNLLLLNIPYKENQILRIATNNPSKLNGNYQLNEYAIDKVVDMKQQFHTEKVVLTMPKFKFKQTISMVEFLKNLGLVRLFNNPQFENLFKQQANVTGISQVNVVDFNLTGTAINSESNVLISVAIKNFNHQLARRSLADEEKSKLRHITLDHPFIYAIIDSKTGADLYLGRVLNMDPEVHIPSNYRFTF